MKKAYVFLALVFFVAGSKLAGQGAVFRGTVVDEQSAVIIGATVAVKSGDRVIAQAKTGAQGIFEIPINPGQYTVEITVEGFEKAVQTVQVSPSMPQASFRMKLAQVQQEVNVQESANQVSLDPSSNLTATVLDEDFIQQLPDDDQELAEYLTELAGPRANAAGGVDFIVDGFTNGILPPKDQILQIKINNNPFTTEFSRPGYGRIEIITKPGSGNFHGNLQLNFRDSALNARNALAPDKPSYERRNYQTSVSGPVVKNRFTISMFATHQSDNDATTLRAIDPLTGVQDASSIASFIQPTDRSNVNLRGQWGVTPDQRHVLNFNVEYGRRDLLNQGVGGFSLANHAFDSHSNQSEIQLRETDILSSSLVHEMRFEVDHNTGRTQPLTNLQTIRVLDAFTEGGANNFSQTKNTNVQFGNALSYSGRILTLKAGLQFEHYSQWQLSENNFLGTYTYSSYAAYLSQQPSTFMINAGIPTVQVPQWEFGSFIQTDWKVSKRLLLSAGARYELQTNIADRNNIDPRGTFAFQLSPSMVVRGGLGTFHQRMSAGTVQTLTQYDGLHQLQTVIRDLVYPVDLTSAAFLAIPTSLDVRAGGLRTPYTINSAISVEKTLKKGLAVTISFDDVKGVHLYRGRDINAPLAGTLIRPNPLEGIITQLESSASSRFDSLTLAFRQRFGNLNWFGNYSLGSSYNDTDGPFSLPSDDYDLASDWGRASNAVRNRIQTGINYRFRWGLIANTNIVANSGHPYNETTGLPTSDGQFNQRPAGVPRNSLTGPGAFNVNLNLSKTFVLREGGSGLPRSGETSQGGQRGAGQGPGPRAGGYPRGGAGGGGGPRGGGPGGGGPGGNLNIGPGGLTMTLFANTQNLFNHANLGTPSGVLTSPYFLRSTSSGIPRTIEVGVRFNF